MRLLFELDQKDYDETMPRFVRPSVRGIIIRNGKIAMVHSLKYDYYKFPGGGIESAEEHLATLIREVREETGLAVIPESVQEYGCVHRVQKGNYDDVLVQDNYYYLCQTYPETGGQNLDAYEAEEQFTLEFVLPQHAIDTNRLADHGKIINDCTFPLMIEREARVLDLLMKEKLI